MKIRMLAVVSAAALALTLGACSEGTSTVAAVPVTTAPAAPTTTQPVPATTPVVTETPAQDPYELGIPATADNTVAWSRFVKDAKDRFIQKFGAKSINNGNAQIYYLTEGEDVLTIDLKGKAGEVMVYPQGTSTHPAEPYVYYTLEAGKKPNLATMPGKDEENGTDYASSSTESRQRSETAYQLARKLLDELFPAS